MKRQHDGQGVGARPVLRAPAPDTVEHMLGSVPALRRAGLEEVADSIEAMAREAGIVAVAGAASAETNAPEPDVAATPGARARDRFPVAALMGRSRLGLGASIVVAVAGLGRICRLAVRVGRAARHSLIRRRELVWGALAVSSMSLLVGWVITRLP